MNNPVTREKLVETIHSNYIRHLANQPYLARAIKELKPAYDTLGKEVEEFVRVLELCICDIEPFLFINNHD